MLDVEPQLRLLVFEAESAESSDAGSTAGEESSVSRRDDGLRARLPQARRDSVEHDDAGEAWENGIAREWPGDLADPRQDIWTLDDGGRWMQPAEIYLARRY